MKLSPDAEVQAGPAGSPARKSATGYASSPPDLLSHTPLFHPHQASRDTSDQAESSTRTVRAPKRYSPEPLVPRTRPQAEDGDIKPKKRRITGEQEGGTARVPARATSTSAEVPPGWLVDEELFGDLPIAYLDQFKVFRCNVCATGLRSLQDHFARIDRHDIDYRESLVLIPPILARYEERNPYSLLPKDLTPSNPYPTFIPGLDITDGYSCLRCGFNTVQHTYLSAHLRTAHTNPVDGRPSEPAAYTRCRALQRFYKSTGAEHWFPSTVPPSGATEPAAPSRRKGPVPGSSRRTSVPKTGQKSKAVAGEPIAPTSQASASSSSSTLVPSSPNLGSSGYIMQDELFGSLPIAYHPSLAFFLCTLCNKSLKVIFAHFASSDCHYAGAIPPPSQLELLVARYPQHTPSERLQGISYPDNPYPTFVTGINYAATGYRCVHCTYLTNSTTNLCNHMWYAHGQKWKTEHVPHNTVPHVQQVFEKGGSPWFPSSAPPADLKVATGGPDAQLLAVSGHPLHTAQQHPSSPSSLHILTGGAHSTSSPDPPSPIIVPLPRESLGPPSRQRSQAPVATPVGTEGRAGPSNASAPPTDMQQALQTIDQLRPSVDQLKKDQAEMQEKQIATEASLRAALEKVRELEAVIESGAAGRAAQQKQRTTIAEAAAEKLRKAKEALEQAQAEAEAAKALAQEPADDDEMDVAGMLSGSLRGSSETVNGDGGEENVDVADEDVSPVVDPAHRQYIPLAEMIDDNGTPIPWRPETGFDLEEGSRASSRASSYEAFQDAVRASEAERNGD